MTLMTLNTNTARAKSGETVKLMYSYGGKIIPRRTDGKLCYIGGHTRVLSLNRSISFAELMVKFGDLCGSSMCLKCKLPSEDLDVLVSITSDEDLTSIIDEYDRYSSLSHKDAKKIRAILFPFESLNKKIIISPSSSVVSSRISSPTSSAMGSFYSPVDVGVRARCLRNNNKNTYEACLSPRRIYNAPHLYHLH